MALNYNKLSHDTDTTLYNIILEYYLQTPNNSQFSCDSGKETSSRTWITVMQIKLKLKDHEIQLGLWSYTLDQDAVGSPRVISGHLRLA